MNSVLEPYNVQLVCKDDVVFDIKEVQFGLLPNHVVDITDAIKTQYFHGKKNGYPHWIQYKCMLSKWGSITGYPKTYLCTLYGE
jgi:hypothetical protein